MVVHVVDAVIVEVVCVVPPRTEIGNLCRLCAVVGILTAYRGLWLPPPGSCASGIPAGIGAEVVRNDPNLIMYQIYFLSGHL